MISPGSRFRSPGGAIAADFFKSLGAEAGMVPFSGMYEALKVPPIRWPERPARRRIVIEALRGADLFEPDRALVVGFHLARQCRGMGPPCRALPKRWSSATPRNSLCCNARTSSRSTPPAPKSWRAAACRSTPPIPPSFRVRLGDFYKSWREKAGPELWRSAGIRCRRPWAIAPSVSTARRHSLPAPGAALAARQPSRWPQPGPS